MKIIFTPDGDAERAEEYPIDIQDLWVGEVKLLEKVLKETIVEIGEHLDAGSFTHMMAVLWIYRRRNDRDLRLDDIDDQVKISWLIPVFEDDAEVAKPAPKEVVPASPSTRERPAASPKSSKKQSRS